jgi:hypothetical protein
LPLRSPDLGTRSRSSKRHAQWTHPPNRTTAETSDYCYPDPDGATDFCDWSTDGYPSLTEALAEPAFGDTSAEASALQKNQYGISGEIPSTFDHPLFRPLKLRNLRIQISWDVFAQGDPVTTPTASDEARRMWAWFKKERDFSAWYHGQTGHYPTVLVSIKQSRGNKAYRPSIDEYAASVRQLRNWFAKYGFSVNYYTAWNEPNLSDATRNAPYTAGLYFRQLKRICGKSCTPIAGDFLDMKNLETYLGPYKNGAGSAPKIWAYHPYTDGDRHSTSRLDDFLVATRESSDVWLTESGGVLLKRNGNWSQTATEALGDLNYLLNTITRYVHPGQRSRIKRFYLYQWKGDPKPGWDSGLIAPDGTTRTDMYCAFKAKTVGGACP